MNIRNKEYEKIILEEIYNKFVILTIILPFFLNFCSKILCNSCMNQFIFLTLTLNKV